MENHAFVGETTEGYPVVMQVLLDAEGALAQVCAVCGKPAAEDGTTPDHPEPGMV